VVGLAINGLVDVPNAKPGVPLLNHQVPLVAQAYALQLPELLQVNLHDLLKKYHLAKLSELLLESKNLIAYLVAV
jgi:hypothetical protein